MTETPETSITQQRKREGKQTKGHLERKGSGGGEDGGWRRWVEKGLSV
jgi:hypothetical protein